MLARTPINVFETVRPGSFADLMEVYENNYIYLRRLVPRMPARATVVSRRGGRPDLYLRVTEQCRYTTGLVLTHRFVSPEGLEVIPDLHLRVYHDARVAEVMPGSSLGGPLVSSTAAPGTLAWRWSMNRFLSRWLRHCLAEGHAFVEPH